MSGCLDAYGDDGGHLDITIIGTGSIVANGSAEIGGSSLKGKLIVNGGSIEVLGDAAVNDGGNSGALIVDGGSISSKNSWYDGISVGSVTVKKGRVSVTGDGQYGIDCNNLDIQGGSVNITNSKMDGIQCKNLMKISGGNANLSHGDGSAGIDCSEKFRMSGGSVTIDDQDGYGIKSTKQLTMTGGVLKVTRGYDTAICVPGYDTGGQTYRGKTAPRVHHDGVIKITGGKVTAITRSAKKYSAITTDRMTNKPACLASITGQIDAPGATFKKGTNTYESAGDHFVKLSKYGTKSTNPKFKRVKYGSYIYDVSGFGTEAFATQRGKKVRSITLNNLLYAVDINAFKGAKSLKTLRIGDLSNLSSKYKKGKLKWIKWDKSSKVAKGAFKGCNDGLNVIVGKNGVWEHDVPAYRKLFITSGMPKSFKLESFS